MNILQCICQELLLHSDLVHCECLFGSCGDPTDIIS